jgi:hypothetical protein
LNSRFAADTINASAGSVPPQMSEGAHLMIWGMRHLMAATLQRRAVPPSVSRAFEPVGGSAVYRRMTALLLLTARDADRPLLIQPPCSPVWSADEESLARVLGALTRHSSALAQWRTLLGRAPSASLQRYARAVGESFSAAGLSIGIV